MNVNNVVRTITIKGVSDGVEKLTGDVNKLAAAQQNVAVVSETSARRVLSLEDAWKKQTLKLDEAARSQANIARESKIADGALREGLITQQQHAERLNMISQRYAVATVQAGKFAQQTGLNRYEILNFSRQIQDVGVSLAGGQSPFVVLAQQGSQIADIFQATNGSVRGFATQAVGWLGRFATSAAGAATGVAAIGAAALYSASAWADSQREIERSLIGIGRRSGATVADINQIARAGATTTGLSVDQARDAALEFVKTGAIYKDNIKAAVAVTHDFAIVTGQDAKAAATDLAKALADPAAGADILNQKLGFLDGRTRELVISLSNQNRIQEAQKIILDGVASSTAKAADTLGVFEKAWAAVGNAASAAKNAVGSALSGPNQQEQLDQLRSRRQQLTSGPGIGLFNQRGNLGEIARLDAEIQKLEESFRKAAAAAADDRFKQFSIEADNAVKALIPQIAQLEKLAKLQADIKRGQSDRNVGGRQGLADSNQEAANAAELLGMNLKNAREETARANAVALQLMETYKTSSREIALMRAGLADQLVAASAVGGQARLAAQEQAAYNDLIRQGKDAQDAAGVAAAQRAVAQAQITTQAKEQAIALQIQLPVMQAVTGQQQIQAQYQATINQMLHDGVPLVQAMAVAEAQRANSLAQVNAEADRTLKNLQQQGQLLQASSQFEKDRIQAAQTYADLTAKGVDSEKARAVAGQQLANADLAREAQETADAERQAANETQRRAQAAQQYSAQAERAAAAARAERIERERILAAFKFLPTFGNYTMGKDLFQSGQGGYSQFDPQGYKTSIDTPQLSMAKQMYGEGGFDPKTMRPNAQGFLYQTNQSLAGRRVPGFGDGGNLQGAISGLLSTKTSGPGALGSVDAQALHVAQRLIELLPEQEKGGFIEQQLAMLRAQPQSVETIEAIHSLEQSLDQLRNATEANTQAITDVLSPFYSSDPRRTHLGFRAFAGGGIMTPYGELPLKKYDGGGIAYSPQVAIYGEGRVPEAYVPVPSGKIPVEMRMPANSNQKQDRPIQVNIVVQGNATPETVDALKRTAYQQAQAMRRALS